MKKTAARLSLELDPTPDILAEVGQRKGRPFADWLCGRDRESARRSAPQDDFEKMRHAGGESG